MKALATVTMFLVLLIAGLVLLSTKLSETGVLVTLTVYILSAAISVPCSVLAFGKYDKWHSFNRARRT